MYMSKFYTKGTCIPFETLSSVLELHFGSIFWQNSLHLIGISAILVPFKESEVSKSCCDGGNTYDGLLHILALLFLVV